MLLPPLHQAGFQRALEVTHAHLTPAAFDAAHTQAVGLTMQRIVASALRAPVQADGGQPQPH